jgi:hypothetical protein
MQVGPLGGGAVMECPTCCARFRVTATLPDDTDRPCRKGHTVELVKVRPLARLFRATYVLRCRRCSWQTGNAALIKLERML